MRKKLLKISALAAVGFGAWFSINIEAQTNSAWGRMMWSNYGPDSIKASWAMTNPMDGSLTAPDGHYLIPPQRIQLSAKISGEVVTNWTTTSITSPVIPESERNFAVYRPDILNQSGVIKSNTLATIQWHGKPVIVILETVQIGTTTRTTCQNAQQ